MRGSQRSRPWRAEVLAVECDIRDPDSIAAALRRATDGRFGLPERAGEQRAANFPVPAEDMSPNAWRTVVDITLNGTFFCTRSSVGVTWRQERRHRSSTSVRRTRGPAGRVSPTPRRPRPG